MEFIRSIIDFIIHLDRHLDQVIRTFGQGAYLLVFLVIFAETGLVVTPFLPGDSLLFVLGAFAAKGSFDLVWLLGILAAAAIAGDTVNYAVGHFLGERIVRKGANRFFKKEHIDRTHAFFEKHGGKTIILARFIPIVRTFAPFVAGIGKMHYGKFLLYNVTGGLLWVCSFVLGGYYFGNVPMVKEHFLIVVIVIILISILPAVIEVWKHRQKKA
ncbi:MAG TPA: DedA family protein [Candidatus Omnitrophota bacterium]|nr:DedA family protein [Candidatus Omnitrophota bacterium]HRZ15409.1 DedA family protein [Candidatus Omnitrophota bacterium]